MEIILASGSPRRKELMELAGYRFSVEVSDADEAVEETEPGRMVEELAWRKAAAVAGLHNGKEENLMVIGADTVVILDGRVLGKPENEAHAASMLRDLSGRVHEVYTGVALLEVEGGRIVKTSRFHECTGVRMREIADEEIEAYLRTGEPMDKAGAYGIQGRAAIFVSEIRGDYYNVVGLPICRLTTVLKTEG